MRASPLIRRTSIGSSSRTLALGAMSAIVVCTTASSPSEGRTCAMYRKKARLGPRTSTPSRLKVGWL